MGKVLKEVFKQKKWNVGLLLLSLSLIAMLVACGASETETTSPSNKEEESSSAEVNDSVSEEEQTELDFPTQDIEMIIPFGAGGGTDQVARMLISIAQEKIDQDIVGVNMPGGVGSIGYTEILNANPDGYTIGMATSGMVTNKLVGVSDITYEDVEQIIGVNFDAPGLFVSSDSPWQTAEEFIEHAQANRVQIATGSPKGAWHMGALDLQQKANLNVNIQPAADGGGGAATELLGGHVDAIIVPPNEAKQVETGEFRMLGTMTEERLDNFPDVPTFKELGYDVQVASYRSIVTTKGTPPEVVNFLHDLFKEAVEDERYVNYMEEQLSNTINLDPIELLELRKRENELYTELIPALGLDEE